MSKKITIIGGGLAGLTCARTLHHHGIDFQILEANDHIGGRVHSDLIEGYRLDRGFQVYLTAYPNASRMLDHDRLDLKTFRSGALVRLNGKMYKAGDPFRHPGDALSSIMAPFGSFGDKFRILTMRRNLSRSSVKEIFDRPSAPTKEILSTRWGFSDQIIESFFRPFLGGILLDPDLSASSRMFEFVMRMFTLGHAALPAKGMAEIPQQLASGLPEQTIHKGRRVQIVDGSRIVLDDGSEIASEATVLATDVWSLSKWLSGFPVPTSRSTRTLYFSANRSPLKGKKWLVLNGEGAGPINSVAVPSDVSSEYAPEGKSLISVSVLENHPESDGDLLTNVYRQFGEWFGRESGDWRHLATYTIHRALPNQVRPLPFTDEGTLKVGDNLWICGDHLVTGSIEGAMQSGEKTGLSIVKELSESGLIDDYSAPRKH